EFVRVKLESDGEAFVARPTGNQSSGVLSSLSRADGLLIGPAAKSVLKTGDYAEVLLLAPESGPVEASFFEERVHNH
ncbi:MAG TPA: hypothetical protein VMT58_06120, partial [Candidatus Binataceae bacterium]|nr:hypothetical protein [Candidatus Binataceae bacterium]